jgi:hypothetical protein
MEKNRAVSAMEMKTIHHETNELDLYVDHGV